MLRHTRSSRRSWATLDTLYSDFDDEPIAAASLGQVYKGETTDGQPVAIGTETGCGGDDHSGYTYCDRTPHLSPHLSPPTPPHTSHTPSFLPPICTQILMTLTRYRLLGATSISSRHRRFWPFSLRDRLFTGGRQRQALHLPLRQPPKRLRASNLSRPILTPCAHDGVDRRRALD